MATLARVRVVWGGPPAVGGGVSTFYCSNSDPAVFNVALRAFFLSLNGAIPTGASMQVPGSGDTIDSATGAINGAWAGTTPAAVTGAGGGNWAAGVGARVTWKTAGIIRRRRVQGSTFIVPLIQAMWSSNGTLDDTFVTNATASANTLRAADGGSMRIWSRPKTASSGDGVAWPVTAGVCPDAVSWLRSRRT